MLILVAGLMLAGSLSAAPADVTGKWEGSVTATREDGTQDHDRALIILEQKGGEITGTIGGGEDDQHPISKGTIEGDKVTITATHRTNGRELRLELTLSGDELKGTVETAKRRGEVTLKRQKTI
jgi:hypothetical protein